MSTATLDTQMLDFDVPIDRDVTMHSLGTPMDDDSQSQRVPMDEEPYDEAMEDEQEYYDVEVYDVPQIPTPPDIELLPATLDEELQDQPDFGVFSLPIPTDPSASAAPVEHPVEHLVTSFVAETSHTDQIDIPPVEAAPSQEPPSVPEILPVERSWEVDQDPNALEVAPVQVEKGIVYPADNSEVGEPELHAHHSDVHRTTTSFGTNDEDGETPVATHQELSGDPHEISEGVFIDPPPAVLLSFSSSTSNEQECAFFNQPLATPRSNTPAQVLTLFLHNRPTLYYEPLAHVFKALRQDALFAARLPDAVEGELVLDAYDIALVISEDNIYAREITLHDLNVIHDGLELRGPLRVQLGTVLPRFITRYHLLQERISIAANTVPGEAYDERSEAQYHEEIQALEDGGHDTEEDPKNDIEDQHQSHPPSRESDSNDDIDGQHESHSSHKPEPSADQVNLKGESESLPDDQHGDVGDSVPLEAASPQKGADITSKSDEGRHDAHLDTVHAGDEGAVAREGNVVSPTEGVGSDNPDEPGIVHHPDQISEYDNPEDDSENSHDPDVHPLEHPSEYDNLEEDGVHADEYNDLASEIHEEGDTVGVGDGEHHELYSEGHDNDEGHEDDEGHDNDEPENGQIEVVTAEDFYKGHRVEDAEYDDGANSFSRDLATPQVQETAESHPASSTAPAADGEVEDDYHPVVPVSRNAEHLQGVDESDLNFLAMLEREAELTDPDNIASNVNLEASPEASPEEAGLDLTTPYVDWDEDFDGEGEGDPSLTWDLQDDLGAVSPQSSVTLSSTKTTSKRIFEEIDETIYALPSSPSDSKRFRTKI